MAVVQVSGLVERNARLEIEACPLLTCIAIHLSEPLVPHGSTAGTQVVAAIIGLPTRWTATWSGDCPAC